MNLYQKIIEVRKIAGGFAKDKKSFGYEYVSGNQILNKIKDKMNEVGLILQPSTQAGEHELFCYVNAKGQDKVDIQVWGKMSYTWINADEPTEREVIPWVYYGQQDDISKAFGSALTYSERYFLLKYFGLPTDDDDPDAKESKDKKPIPASKKTLSDAQVKRLYAIASTANITQDKVKAQIKKVFNKDSVTELTKAEYDTVCNGYEKKAKEVSNE